MFLEKFTTSINSQTNIKSSGNDSQTAKFYKQFLNELFPILQCLSILSYPMMITFINTGKTLAPWVLTLEQESYMSYFKKVMKKILQNRDPSHSSLHDFNNIHNISVYKYYLHNPT